MNNKEKFNKELEQINAPEELINKTKNKIETLTEEKKRPNKLLISTLALACTLVIAVIIGNAYLTNNSQKYFENEKVIKNREYSSLFLKNIDKDITEEDTKKLVITINNEEITIDNPEIYKKTMELIEKFTGNSKNIGKTSKVKFNMESLKNYYRLYEKDLILLTINDKYIIKIPRKKNTAILIIDLTKEKFTDYTIYPNQENESYEFLNELREYLTNEYNKEAEEQQKEEEEKENQPENNEEETTQTPNNGQQETVVPKKYGDVDRNGLIQSKDVTMIKQHVAGTNKITDPEARIAADVNGDGLITGADAVLLQYAVVKAIEFDGNSPITAILYGDINMDGVITQADYNEIKKHIDGDIKLTYTNIADINNDGKVDGTDLFLIEGIINGTFNHSNMISPLTNYILYGDIDLNGSIQSRDATVLKQYLNGSITLDKQQLKNADVNADGVIDEKDVKLIQEFVVQMHENTLPFKPIK